MIITNNSPEGGVSSLPHPAPDAGAAARDDSFAEAYRLHYRRLLGYVIRLTGEPDLAADIVQESFVRLHAQGRALEAPGPWLVTVATNLLRNARSRGARRAQLAADAVLEDAQGSRDAAERREEQQRVRRALATLPAREQELLALLAGGYRYREMAQALGIHEASVGTLLARAKRAFRTAYGSPDGTS